MRIDDAFNFKLNDDFGCNGDDDYDDYGWYNIYDLPEFNSEKDHIAHGVTKLVIFPFENPNFVIKLPFSGMWFMNEEDDYIFDRFTVIEDYCAEEADIYDEAVQEGIEEFFASTKFGGFTKDGTAFYVSERVISFSRKESTSKDSYDKAKSLYSCLPTSWLADAIEYYGFQKVKHLINFLEEHDLKDFHSGNVGMREDGAPCLLDYSDFREDF